MKTRVLTREEVEALYAFALAEGRTWKASLRENYWYHARIWRPGLHGSSQQGSILHALRNDPRWGYEGLERMTFAKLEAMHGAVAGGAA